MSALCPADDQHRPALVRSLALSFFLLLTISACSQGEAPALSETPTVVAETERSTRGEDARNALRSLADRIWAATVEDSTYLRLQEGLPINRFEDLTLEQYHKDQERNARFRTELQAIDSNQLSGDDLITYEILALQLEDNGANDDDFWLSFDVTAYLAPYNFQFARQALATRQITDPDSAEQYLALVGELADMIDHLVTKVKGQVERGIFLPKPALQCCSP